MLSKAEASTIVTSHIPDGTIQKTGFYKDLYIFMVFNSRPEEEEMDPFYSVNSNTGKFSALSIFEIDYDELVQAFERGV